MYYVNTPIEIVKEYPAFHLVKIRVPGMKRDLFVDKSALTEHPINEKAISIGLFATDDPERE